MPGDMVRRSVRLILVTAAFLTVFSAARSAAPTNWELLRYPDASPVCAFTTAVPSPPEISEIRSFCGDSAGIEFALTPICEDSTRSTCVGLFLFNTDSGEIYASADYAISGAVEFPPEIGIHVLNCEPNALCRNLPVVEFTDLNPTRADRQFSVTVDEASYACQGGCSLEINTASEKTGSWLTVRTETPSGSQVHHRVFFRLKRLAPSPPVYFFDWIPSESYGGLPYGAEIWGVTPAGIERALLDGSILDPSVSDDDLWSEYRLHGLCAELIYRGSVRAAGCPGFGLSGPTAVNACGLDACRSEAVSRQNRMNAVISHASERFRIPPKLLKNLILAETQFTRHRGQPGEVGVGHLTGLSIDTLLRWSDSAFAKACSTIFPRLPAQCEAGYDGMEAPYRELLKGAVLRESSQDEGVSLSAQILNACKNQVKWLLKSLTERSLGETVDYVTLWKLTVATYHAGGECTNRAIERTLRMNYALDWTHLRAAYVGKCRSGAVYVDRVFNPEYATYGETANPE